MDSRTDFRVVGDVEEGVAADRRVGRAGVAVDGDSVDAVGCDPECREVGVCLVAVCAGRADGSADRFVDGDDDRRLGEVCRSCSGRSGSRSPREAPVATSLRQRSSPLRNPNSPNSVPERLTLSSLRSWVPGANFAQVRSFARSNACCSAGVGLRSGSPGEPSREVVERITAIAERTGVATASAAATRMSPPRPRTSSVSADDGPALRVAGRPPTTPPPTGSGSSGSISARIKASKSLMKPPSSERRSAVWAAFKVAETVPTSISSASAIER